MSLIYDPTLKANLLLDDNSRIRALRQVDEYREIEGQLNHPVDIAQIWFCPQGLCEGSERP